MNAPVTTTESTHNSKYRDKAKVSYKPLASYTLHLLMTVNSDEARAHNDKVLGPDTFGIEVVLDYLKARCGRGNLDPQHKEGGGSSAIEHALGIALPGGTVKLAGMRPDKDFIGAAAVLMLRAEGFGSDISKELVAWIGALDQMGFQNAKIAHPDLFEKVGQDNPAVRLLNLVARDDVRWPTLDAKVSIYKRILTDRVRRRELLDHVQAAAQAAGNNDAEFEQELELYGTNKNIAFLEVPGKYDAARDWLNLRYPVGLVFDPVRKTPGGGTQARWSLVRQENPQKVFDRRGFEKAINEAEAQIRGLSMQELVAQGLTWGGPANIVTCPPGAGNGTYIPKKRILALVQEHLDSGIVS